MFFLFTIYKRLQIPKFGIFLIKKYRQKPVSQKNIKFFLKLQYSNTSLSRYRKRYGQAFNYMKNFKNDMIELLQYRKRYGQAFNITKSTMMTHAGFGYNTASGMGRPSTQRKQWGNFPVPLQYRKRYGQAFNEESKKWFDVRKD